MSVVRFVINLALALVLIAASGLLLALGYGWAAASTWATAGLDVGESGGGWLWLDDEPFYYRFWGVDEGRPIVLVHGLQVEGSQTWASTARGLSRAGVRVLTVDLRGFGRSSRAGDAAQFTLQAQADLLARIVNELGQTDAMLVGHGWGGAVALRMAADQPQLVDSIALLYPEGLADDRPVPPRLVQFGGLGAGLAWSSYAGGPLWTRQQRQGFLDLTVERVDHVDEMRILSRVVGTVDAWRHIAGLPSDDLYGDTAPPEVPLLVVRAASAEQVHLPEWLLELPEERVASTDAGRWLHIEQADAVNALLLAFYRER